MVIVANGLLPVFGCAAFTPWTSWCWWWVRVLEVNTWKKIDAKRHMYMCWEQAAESWHKRWTHVTGFEWTMDVELLYLSSLTLPPTSFYHLLHIPNRNFFIFLLDNRLIYRYCEILLLLSWWGLSVAGKPLYIFNKAVRYKQRVWRAVPHPCCQCWR